MLWELPTEGASPSSPLQPHFSPRFARYFVENGTNHRHLFKVFGIRFDILVDGKVSGGQSEGQPGGQGEWRAA